MIRPRAGAGLFGWPVGLSVGVHVAGLMTAATVAALTPHAAPPPSPTSIEIVRLDPPPPAPAAKPPRPAPRPVKPEVKSRPEEAIVAPRLITQPAELAPPEPLPPAALLDDKPPKMPVTESAPTASSEASHPFPAGASASASWPIPGRPGGAATTGTLLATGDLPVAVGRPGSGGSGGTGPGRDVASAGSGADAPANPTGITSFARPLGGYQTRPRYPDSARREGIEGETLLRFQVLATGRVATVTVARTAGHPDLDRAAVEAVTGWLFEPARRGRDAVTVWVTLPVRFQLDARGRP
jgi:periplasmic protein TonB